MHKVDRKEEYGAQEREGRGIVGSCLGIDVSKASLDIVLLGEDENRETAQFGNTRAGFNKLQRFLKKRVKTTLHAWKRPGIMAMRLRSSCMKRATS